MSKFGENGVFRTQIRGAREVLEAVMWDLYFTHKEPFANPLYVPQWSPDYDQIAQWLTDNEGRGLLLSGGAGTNFAFWLCSHDLQHHFQQDEQAWDELWRKAQQESMRGRRITTNVNDLFAQEDKERAEKIQRIKEEARQRSLASAHGTPLTGQPTITRPAHPDGGPTLSEGRFRQSGCAILTPLTPGYDENAYLRHAHPAGEEGHKPEDPEGSDVGKKRAKGTRTCITGG